MRALVNLGTIVATNGLMMIKSFNVTMGKVFETASAPVKSVVSGAMQLYEAASDIASSIQNGSFDVVKFILDVGMKLLETYFPGLAKVVKFLLNLNSAIREAYAKVSTTVSTSADNISDSRSWMAAMVTEIFNRAAASARSLGSGIHQCITYMYQQCHAHFGSTEYYIQCRMATDMMSRSYLSKSFDVYRTLRLFNREVAAADVQTRTVDARAQGLIDQTKSVARNLKEEVLSKLVPSPTLSSPGSSLTSNRTTICDGSSRSSSCVSNWLQWRADES